MDADALREKIREKLKEKNLTIGEAEKLSKLGPTSLRHFLSGRIKSPTVETLSSLARTLDCNLSELVENSETVITSEDMKKEWNSSIWLEASEYLRDCLKEKEFSITNKHASALINEIYYFSYSKDRKKLDKEFADWLLKSTFIKKGSFL